MEIITALLTQAYRGGIVWGTGREGWKMWASGVAHFPTEKVRCSCKNTHLSEERWWIGWYNDSLSTPVCVRVRERQFVSKPFLELHEGRKPSSTHEVRNWLLRVNLTSQRWQPLSYSMCCSLLQGANIDLATLRKQQQKNYQTICTIDLRQAENIACTHIHIIGVLL